MWGTVSPSQADKVHLRYVESDLTLGLRDESHVLSTPKPTEVGNEGFENEDTVWCKVGRDIPEAANLICLRQKVEERVEDDEDDGKLAVNLHISEIADDHRNGAAARLGQELKNHRLGSVDAGNSDTCLLKG